MAQPQYPAQSKLLVIGNDSRLIYLLRRYAEQGGCQVIFYDSVPADIEQLQPTAVIFSSPEELQAASAWVEILSINEIPVLVCASVADELDARELGADACLLHPLTYENFMTTLSGILPAAN